MPALADRVKDTSTTTGTGNFTLSGTAPTGFQTFNAAFGTTNPFYYVIELDAEWEVGIGELSAATTLVRTTVLASSNANALVSFSAGTKNVFCDAIAAVFDALAPLLSPTFDTDITTPLIIGGTAAGSNILYKSTTGTGTATGIAHQFIGGTNGATVLITILNNGKVGVGTPTPGSPFTVAGNVQFLNPADLTRYLNFTVSSGQWTITSQSGLNITASGSGSLSMGGGGHASLLGPWGVGTTIKDTGLVFGLSTRAVLGGAGLSSGNAIALLSNGYGGAGRLDANIFTIYTGTGASLTSNNSGNGGNIIFDFGLGANATNMAAGSNGKLILRRASGSTGTLGPVLDVQGAITTRELSADPIDPAEGSNVMWQSDGTGAGDDGDIMMKITAGGVTKTVTIVDFSAV